MAVHVFNCITLGYTCYTYLMLTYHIVMIQQYFCICCNAYEILVYMYITIKY